MTTLGWLLAAAYVIGALASLANDEWALARHYAKDEAFRTYTDRIFTLRHPGILGGPIRILSMAILGVGLLLNALVWPGILLYDIITALLVRPQPLTNPDDRPAP